MGDALTLMRVVLRDGTLAGRTDVALLGDYRDGPDELAEAAFAVLVARHAAMVRRTCRRVAGNHHDAEDLAQATFLVLARRAGSVRAGESLAPWLHGVARRLAARANAAATRQHRRERRWARPEIAPRAAFEPEPGAEIHEEVDRLPERYRLPILLCLVEGLSHVQAADRLGCPVRTLQTRLNRGRDRLRSRLARRGLGPAADLLVAPWALEATPWEWAVATAHAVTRPGAAASPLLTETTIKLADGAVRSMIFFRLKVLATVFLIGASTLIGASRLVTTAGPAGSPPAAHASPQDPTPPARIPEKAAPAPPPTEPAGGGNDTPAGFAGRMADHLIRNPLVRPFGTFRVNLYLTEVATGTTTLIVEEPGQGHAYCGSPSWSADGRRLYFDATPLASWELSRVMAFEMSDDGPRPAFLGLGNCPSPAPDGRRIAILSNEAGRAKGVYLMKADGTGREALGEYGRPAWSPDGRQILISTFSTPSRLTLLDVETGAKRAVESPDRHVFSTPRWVDPATVVAALGTADADEVALLDVSNPEKATVRSVLWKKSIAGDPVPTDAVFDPEADRCYFVGVRPEGKAIYAVRPGDPSSRRQLGPEGPEPTLGGLALSPDGRFLVFQSDRRGDWR